LPGDEWRLNEEHDGIVDIFGPPVRPIGARRIKFSAISGASPGNEIVPGATAFTVISGARARARQRVSMITPASIRSSAL